MGKEWDHDKGGRDEWIKWMCSVMVEVKRVLKPGGHCFVWALPRTSHWTATALEDAGFEIRDIVTHVFGSGFPKSHNIGKSIDKKLGNEREVVGKKENKINLNSGKPGDKSFYDSAWSDKNYIDLDITKGTSEYEGWGSGLKPAGEFWILCRKPLSEKTIADNVLKWGTGGINIDKSRITMEKYEELRREKGGWQETYVGGVDRTTRNYLLNTFELHKEPIEGRFPANFIHDGSDEVMEEFDKAGYSKTKPSTIKGHKADGEMGKCLDSARKNDWSSNRNDEGSAARFFYCSKASGREKNEGLDDMPLKAKEFETQTRTNKETADKFGCERRGLTRNGHPCVKPIKLMTYLINMITPHNGIVIDPFSGSFSTGVAAIKAGYKFIGIEKEAEYMEIGIRRIKNIK